MTDMAALSMSVDTSSVLKAANDLDKFTEASTRASAAAGLPGGSIGQIVANVQRYADLMRSLSPANDAAASSMQRLVAAQVALGEKVRSTTADIRAQIEALRELGGTGGGAGGAGSPSGGAAAGLNAAFGALEAAATAAAAALRTIGAPSGGGGGGAGGGAGAGRSSSSPYYGAKDLEATGQAAELARHHAQNLFYQLNDVFVSLTSGQKPMTVFIQQGSQIGQIYVQTGMSVKNFGLALASMLGLMTTTTAETEALALAQAQQSAASVAAANAQATSAVRAAETNIAVATAQIALASTATEAAAGQARLAVATQALATTQAEAAITAQALATAMAEEAAASEAAAAATTTAITTIAIVLGVVAVALAAGAIAWAVWGDKSRSEVEALAKVLASLKVATDGVKDAQSTLGNVFDLTTGKMKTQADAAIALARAQLLVMKATAQNNAAKASIDLSDSSGLGFFGRLTASDSLREGSARVDLLTKSLKGNNITVEQAMKGFQILKDRGQITNEMFLRGSVAAANYGAELENVKTADAALASLNSGKLASQFLDPAKTKPTRETTPRDPLTAILQSAQNSINMENARASGIGETARQAYFLAQNTKILDQLQKANIPITDELRLKVAGLAHAYADVKVGKESAKAVQDSLDGLAKQNVTINDQTTLIGLYGDALTKARIEADALASAQAALPKGEKLSSDAVSSITTAADRNASDQSHQDMLTRMEAVRKGAEDSAYAMDLEAKGLGLTGAAADTYSYKVEQLNAAKKAGITLSAEEMAQIDATAESYGAAKSALDRQAKALADAKEVYKGFGTEVVDSLLKGANAFTAFGNAAVNALQKIVDKLLGETLNSALSSMLGSSGGFLGSLFGGSSAGSSLTSFVSSTNDSLGASMPSLSSMTTLNALGGVYGTPQRFANGGTFTNSIVSTPTLFRFANGGALGEMGEAGPEAIIPLKRGRNGSLGVQVQGGTTGTQSGPATIHMGDVHQTFQLTGTMSQKDVQGMVQQGAQGAVDHIRRNFQNIANEWQTNGAVSS